MYMKPYYFNNANIKQMLHYQCQEAIMVWIAKPVLLFASNLQINRESWAPRANKRYTTKHSTWWEKRGLRSG